MLNDLLVQPLQILYNLPAIIVGLTVHEFMHAYVAVKAGDDTPRMQGRLTLNPMKHLDPIGFLMILLIGFGWAKPVQVNINNLRNRKKSYLFVTLAGVLGNLAIAFVAAAILYFSGASLIENTAAIKMLYAFVYINLMLFALNMLPLPPLDGFGVLTSLVRFKNIKVVMNLRQYGFIIILVLSIVGILGIYISVVSGLIMSGFNGLFSLIAGLVG